MHRCTFHSNLITGIHLFQVESNSVAKGDKPTGTDHATLPLLEKDIGLYSYILNKKQRQPSSKTQSWNGVEAASVNSQKKDDKTNSDSEASMNIVLLGRA